MKFSEVWKNWRMGYYNDQEGILQRYTLEQEHWRSHLENSKEAIRSFCEESKENEVNILGSGWLLDVPMDYLLQKYKKVKLFDIRHPNYIKHKYRNERVEFYSIDLTGGYSEYLFKINKQQLINGDWRLFIPLNPLETIEGIVISCNLLSQLSGLVGEYLQEKRNFNEETTLAIEKTIQQMHWEHLPSNRSLLISDFQEKVYSTSGELDSLKPLVHINMEEKIRQWEWAFDLSGNYKRGRSVRLDVGVFEKSY